MAIRGKCPTVLLLATEVESEWASGSAGDTDTRTSSSTRGGRSMSLDTTTNNQGLASGDARRSQASDDGAAAAGKGVDNNDNGGEDQEGGRGARLSSSSATEVASLNIVEDESASTGGGNSAGISSAARTSSVGGEGSSDVRKSRGDNAGPDAPAPSSLRSPPPLSKFAAPSLADTDDFHYHHSHSHSDNAATADPVAGNALEKGAVTEDAATDDLSSDTNASINRVGASRASNTRSRGSRDAATAVVETVGAAAGPHKNRRRGSVGAGVSNNSPTDGGPINNGGSETDDSGGRVCHQEGGGARGEGEEKVSGWEGLLEVNVRCTGSGNCPLHEAAASGSVGAVLSLLDLGANVNMVNGHGDTALHVGVMTSDAAPQRVGLNRTTLLVVRLLMRLICAEACRCNSSSDLPYITHRLVENNF